MKRRKALKNIGLGFSAGMVLPAWLSSCKEDEPGPEINYSGVVGIVGAGAAGLYVADILRSKGVQVRIFEASSRPCGRVRTLNKFELPTEALLFDPDNFPSSKFPTELGAQFVIGSDSVWGRMLDELNVLEVDFASLSEDSFMIDGLIKTATELAADADFLAATNFYNNLPNLVSPNVSVQQAIASAGINSRVHAILNSWIGNKWGTSNDRLGTTALAEELDLTLDTKILKANPMEDALLSQFNHVLSKVELNSVVKAIDYTGEQITLSGEKTTGGTSEPFTAVVDKLIVTVPVAILKNGSVTFNPPLPASKSTALSRMEMEASIRIRLEFKKNFWGMNTGFLYGGTEGPQYFNAGIGRDEFVKTLDVTVQGPKAVALSPLGKDMIPLILEELDAVYEGQASQNIRKDVDDNILAVIMDWTKEEFIQGGVAHVKPGGTNADRVTLGEAVNGKLFFAGEATDVTGAFGTINGALLSAERAAQEVVESITAA